MKAWSVTGRGNPADVLELQSRELPAPAAGEVQLRVQAAALGLPDVLMCQGNYEFSPEIPFTPGQDVCGVVMAVGEGVTLDVGVRVLGVSSFFNGYGSLSEHCMSMDSMLYPVPEAMSDTEAAAFGIAYQTAWIALVERGAVQSGQTLLVLGAAGGSGSAAIQLGRALGAQVIAVAGGPERCKACLDLGAHYAVDYRNTDYVAKVRQITAQRGVDSVFDPVGGDRAASAARCLARGGKLLAVGFASGSWGDVPARELALGNIELVGVYAGGYSPDERLGFHSALCELYAQGEIKPVIDRQVPFAAVPDALERLRASQVIGKLVTCPGAALD